MKDANLDIRLSPFHSDVTVSGTPSAMVEIGEILAWLGAACRCSPEIDSPSYCSPIVSLQKPSNIIHIKYVYSALGRSEIGHAGNSTCWQLMFRNPAIAMGYPITARSLGEQGLELPLDMMMILGLTPVATSFADTTLLKGFYTAFAPIICIGASTIWHFLVQEDRRRLSCNEALSTAETHGLLDQGRLEGGRHFVGWTPLADIHTGKTLNVFKHLQEGTRTNDCR